MTVLMPRENWTDERLDDLKDDMHREFGQVRAEMKAGFDRVDARFGEVEARFDKVDARFESLDDRFAALNRTLIGGAFAVCASVLAAGIF